MPSYATKSLPSFGFQKWSETGQLGRKMGFFRKNSSKITLKKCKTDSKMVRDQFLHFKSGREMIDFYRP